VVFQMSQGFVLCQNLIKGFCDRLSKTKLASSLNLTQVNLLIFNYFYKEVTSKYFIALLNPLQTPNPNRQCVHSPFSSAL
jgi:hypothetical protein